MASSQVSQGKENFSQKILDIWCEINLCLSRIVVYDGYSLSEVRYSYSPTTHGEVSNHHNLSSEVKNIYVNYLLTGKYIATESEVKKGALKTNQRFSRVPSPKNSQK